MKGGNKDFKIRDKRKNGWFYIDNEYLNGLGKHLGPIGIAVYVSLCRHTNNETQESYPSQEKIAEEISVSRKTVKKYIGLLKEHNVVSITQERSDDGKFVHNVYILMDKEVWIYPGGTKGTTDPWSLSFPSRGPFVSTAVVPQLPTNKTYTNKTNITRLGETPAQKAKDFFTNTEKQKEVILLLEEKGLPLNTAEKEVEKFISYWTELNKTGKKQRWEMEKTFEIGRRLGTWLSRVKDYNKGDVPKYIKIK